MSVDELDITPTGLIYKWHHGVDPDTVDHVNSDKQDNRIENLVSMSLEENVRKGIKNRKDRSH